MSEPRPAPFFIADDRALDFLNSIAAPSGQEIEWLADGRDFIGWLEQSHEVSAEVAERFRACARPEVLDAVASEARELREWLRKFVRRHAGKPLAKSALRDLAPLNRLLERDEGYRQIEVAPSGDPADSDGREHRPLRWRAARRWDGPEALLLPVAEAIGDLVCRADFRLVRQCEGPTCSLWFLDVSKSHGRRWCSMAMCGNRAKAAAHRARARQ